MILEIITYECPTCGSADLVKNGHDYKGCQKYHCRACGRYGTLRAQRGYATVRRAQVQRALLERVSLRGIGRIFQMSRRTVMRWLQGWRNLLASLGEILLSMEFGDVLELDELWSFVGKKENQQWLWLALCRRTRQVVAYYVGDRTTTSALQLWRQCRVIMRLVVLSVTSGRLIVRYLTCTAINLSLKLKVKLIMLNAGLIPCANAWLGLPVKPWLFLNRTSTMRRFCICLFSTTN